MRTTLSRLAYSPWFARWTQAFAEWRVSRTKLRVPKRDKNGLPLPSAYLIARVAGSVEWQDYLETGANAVRVFRDMLARHDGDFEFAERILDFGCGCGRVARYVPNYSRAELYGTDINRQLARWSAANLPGTFHTNRLMPPLRYGDEFFDVIYLFSVFTHLRQETQQAWLKEFHRILKPGGHVLISFHDEDLAAVAAIGMTADDVRRDDFIIHNDRAEGSNYISTYQSRAQFAAQAAQYFDVCEILSSQESGVGQAVALLRRSQ